MHTRHFAAAPVALLAAFLLLLWQALIVLVDDALMALVLVGVVAVTILAHCGGREAGGRRC